MARSKGEARIPSKPVRIELFDIQGHNGSRPLDYAAFFDLIYRQRPRDRQEQVADRVIAVPTFQKVGSRYTFVAYWGSTDRSFLVFDIENQSEEIRHIEAGKIMATRTVGILDPEARKVAIQYVHTGVRAPQIAVLFEKLGHERGPDFAGATLEFAPIAGESFRQRLAAMDRVQEADFTLTRPNYDWGDYADQLSSLAGDSQAQRIAVSAVAKSRESLSKNKGVVQLIRNLVRDGGRSVLKSASIKGFIEGNSAPIVLNLNKHVESKTVLIPLARDGFPSPPEILQAGAALLDDKAAAS